MLENVEIIAAILLGGVGTAAVGAIAMWEYRKRVRRRELWAQIARQRGGRHVLPSGFLRRTRERIEVEIDGIDVVLETYHTSTGKSSVPWTRCTATARYRPFPRFSVYRNNPLSALGKLLGTQDVALGGDPAFDDNYMVKTDDAPAVRELWSSRAKNLLRTRLPRASVESKGTGVETLESDTYSEEDKIEAALELVAELTGRDVHGTEAMRAVAGPGFRAGEKADRPSAELRAPALVSIRSEAIGELLATVIRLGEALEFHPATGPLTVAIAQGRLTEPAQANRLPQGALVHLEAVEAGTLYLDREGARLQFPQVVRNTERLRAGAELVGSLAGGGQRSVFR